MTREEVLKLYQNQSQLKDLLWERNKVLELSNNALAKDIGIHPISLRNWFILNKRLNMVNVNKVISYLEK